MNAMAASPEPSCDENQDQVNTDNNIATGTLSKSQLKKQLKQQRWIASRGERRQKEREKDKLKRRLRYEERIKNGEPIPSRKPNLMAESQNKFRVVIDMDFNEFMTEMEMKKAAQQVSRIYSLNRHSKSPCQLYISSLSGKILEQFKITNTGYLNWDVNVSESDYSDIFECDTTKQDDTELVSSTNKFKNIVYLTGDSETNLPDVDALMKDESKIYVIGGLVDHNRHKNLCHQRALERNIATARLPIKENITLCQRHILSTVTVFEILLLVLSEHLSWPEALARAIPKRKIAPAISPKAELKQEDTSQQDDDTSEIKA